MDHLKVGLIINNQWMISLGCIKVMKMDIIMIIIQTIKIMDQIGITTMELINNRIRYKIMVK